MQDKNGKLCVVGARVRVDGYVPGHDQGVVETDYGQSASVRMEDGYRIPVSTFQISKVEDDNPREVGIRHSTPVSCGDVERGLALVACECGLTRAFDKPHAYVRPSPAPIFEGDAKHLQAACESEQIAITQKIEFQKKFNEADDERIRLQSQNKEQEKTISVLRNLSDSLQKELTTKPRALLADKASFAERNASQLTTHLSDAQTTIADHESTIRVLRRTVETWKERAKKLGWRS